jgi:putative transposase
LFSRKPVGWAMSFFPDSALTGKALSMAWEARGKPANLLYHSDQGSHYTSRNFSEASTAITNYIMGYYSQLRPHQYNGGLTPNESERLFWKNSKAVASFC